MTHEDIIRMAREAADPDAVDPLCGSDWGDLITLDLDEMVRFAALVAAHEREACARLCDEIETQSHALWKRTYDPDAQGRSTGAADCADAIRARSN